MTKPNILLAAVLAGFMGLLSVTATTAKSFKTPEAAITAYIEGVAAHDFDKVLAATAIDEMSTGFDFVAYVDRLKALFATAPAPSSDPMFVAINKANYIATIARQVQFLTYGLLSTSAIAEGKTVEMDGVGASDFEAQAAPARLEALILSKIGSLTLSATANERYLENSARQAQTYGADELVERVALVTLEGRSYFVGFTVLRYGDSWGISSQVSNLAGTLALGTPVPITPQEFDAGFE